MFDRRLWDYDANIERGLEILILKASAALSRFRAGQHYLAVPRAAPGKYSNGIPTFSGASGLKLVTSPNAAQAWKKLEGTTQGNAMIQREIVRGFGGGFEFTYFPSTDSWDIWTTAASQFWEVHVDNKIRPAVPAAQGYPTPFPRKTDPDEAGQGTFVPAAFGPNTSETGTL